MVQVICVGLGRTGTQSLAAALEILGVTPIYNMYPIATKNQASIFEGALDAKYEGKGRAFTREDFDSFLSGYKAISDIPATIFPLELVAAYPTAKIILTTRPEDVWYESMLSTLWHSYKHAPNPNAPTKHLADRYHGLLWDGDFERNGRSTYRKYNEGIRKAVVPLGRLLDYEVKDGWEPLCEFLGMDVPDVPFPRQDAWVSYKERQKSS